MEGPKDNNGTTATAEAYPRDHPDSCVEEAGVEVTANSDARIDINDNDGTTDAEDTYATTAVDAANAATATATTTAMVAGCSSHNNNGASAYEGSNTAAIANAVPATATWKTCSATTNVTTVEIPEARPTTDNPSNNNNTKGNMDGTMQARDAPAVGITDVEPATATARTAHKSARGSNLNNSHGTTAKVYETTGASTGKACNSETTVVVVNNDSARGFNINIINNNNGTGNAREGSNALAPADATNA